MNLEDLTIDMPWTAAQALALAEQVLDSFQRPVPVPGPAVLIELTDEQLLFVAKAMVVQVALLKRGPGAP